MIYFIVILSLIWCIGVPVATVILIILMGLFSRLLSLLDTEAPEQV